MGGTGQLDLDFPGNIGKKERWGHFESFDEKNWTSRG
jgi:hypothetical protein